LFLLEIDPEQEIRITLNHNEYQYSFYLSLTF
jgi:hypothetical protein